MFFVFFMIHQAAVMCLGITVVWHKLQYASSERSLAFFNQRNVFSKLLLFFSPYHNCSSTFRMAHQLIELVYDVNGQDSMFEN